MNKIAQSEAAGPARWLLLIHQLPAKAAYARVKVWRRLQALGAVTVKNSVYALPIGERSLEDFEWLMKEVVASGGEGMICEARLVSGLFDEELCQLFNAAREGEYREAAKAVRALAQAIGSAADAPTRADARSRLKRLKAEVRVFSRSTFSGRTAAKQWPACSTIWKRVWRRRPRWAVSMGPRARSPRNSRKTLSG